MALAKAGRPDEAVTLIEEAMRLSPKDSAMPNWLSHLASAHFTARHNEDARDLAEKCIALSTNDPWGVLARCYQMLAANRSYLGDLDDARNALRRALYRIGTAQNGFPIGSPRPSWVSGLRRSSVAVTEDLSPLPHRGTGASP